MGCLNSPKTSALSARDQRVQNHEGLHALIEAWTRSLSTDEAVERLERAEVPSGRVRDPGQPCATRACWRAARPKSLSTPLMAPSRTSSSAACLSA